MFTTLIEPAQLAAHLDDPDWSIVDCRFDLGRPGWGAQVYASGHIPHALYAHLDEDLSAPRTPRSGRHPLPQVETLAAAFGRFGIDARVQVIGYDQGTGAFAARLWWLLRWLGHPAVAVLDGGLAAWERAGMPLSSALEPRAARQFVPRVAPHLIVAGTEVAEAVRSGALRRGEQLLIDARSADRFAGENETIDAHAGHIPGARNHPYAGNLDAQGRFLAAGRLRAAWQSTLRGASAQQLISMCGSGVTACHNLLALEAAGLSGARLYPGSWSEWITDPARAVARGPE